MDAGRGRLGKIAVLALLTLAHAAPGAALSCVHFPFQQPGERFGTKELVAHISVDAAGALGWNMPQQWGFEPFRRSTQWVIVMLPVQKGRTAWQPQLCRAFLKVEGGSAVGYVSDLTIRDRVTLEDLAAQVVSADLCRPRQLSCSR